MSSPKPALNCLKSVARYELDSYIAIDSICVIAEANAIELGARLLSRVPAGWWEDFWKQHQENTGDSRAQAVTKLIKLLGKNYREQPVCDLYLRDLLAEQAN